MKEIVCFLDGDGFLFCYFFGKILRGGGKINIFMIKECLDLKICLVVNLRLYVKLCDFMCVNWREGYLFRVLNSKSEIFEDFFVGFVIVNRFILYLCLVGIYDREIMYSFRSGCLIILFLLGVFLEDVVRYVGWFFIIIVDYYL